MTHPTDGPSFEDALLDALPDALADLPADLPPPPHLDAAVLRDSGLPAEPVVSSAAPLTARWPRWSVGVALAAGVLLGLTIGPAAKPTLVLTPGAHHIEGPATVKVPGGVLTLDGVAAISMEPAPGTLREDAPSPHTSEPTMFTPRDLLSAGGGAAVTVALLAGTGTWTSTDAEGGQVLEVGDGLKVAPGDRPTKRATLTTRTQADPAAPPTIDALQSENASLREARDALDFEVKALRGQLAAYGATAIEWPDDLPSAYEPAPFSAWAESMVADVPGFTLAEVDCSEFPCLVLVEPGPDAPHTADGGVDWDALAESFKDSQPPGVPEALPTSAGISVMETNDNGERSGVMVLYNAPDSHLGDGVPERLQVRTRDAVQRLAEADAPQ